MTESNKIKNIGNIMNWFIYASVGSFLVALLHIIIVFFLGAEGYRTFGAGEEFAIATEQGSFVPHLITLGITLVFIVFGFYALSGNQFIKPLPFLKWGLIGIASIFTIRGIAGIPMYFLMSYEAPLMLWSSLVSLSIGVFHILGIHKNWNFLEKL